MRASIFVSTLSALVFALASLSHAQVATSGGMTSDAHCGKDYCVTAIYSPQARHINYTLITPRPGSQVGWMGFAQGAKMAGANMAINWVNPDGSLTTSHRSAAGEVYPLEILAEPLADLTVNSGVSSTSAQQTVWSWSIDQPTAPGNRMDHIFASAPTAPAGSASSTHVPMHDHYEYPIILDMTKPYDGSPPAGHYSPSSSTSAIGGINGTTSNGTNSYPTFSTSGVSGMRDLSKTSTKLLLVHMIFMVLGWSLIAPIGVLVARFGRTVFTWFPIHRAIQGAASLFIAIGFFLAFAYIQVEGDSHFSGRHQKFGLALYILLHVQIGTGVWAHSYKRKTGNRYVGYFHMPFGILMLGLSVYTIHLGFETWNWNPPNYASYIIYAWNGFLALVYIAGLALIPKELRQASAPQEKIRS